MHPFYQFCIGKICKLVSSERVKGQWIFGAICCETREFFVVPVDKRDSATLISIITSKVFEGSTIISDC